MSEHDGYAFWLASQYGPIKRRTRWQRYAWCARHPIRAWRTRGCGL